MKTRAHFLMSNYLQLGIRLCCRKRLCSSCYCHTPRWIAIDLTERWLSHRLFLHVLLQHQTVQTKVRLRSEEHTSELQSRPHLVCRLLLEKKKKKQINKLAEITKRCTER